MTACDMLSGLHTLISAVFKLMLKKLSYSNECVIGLGFGLSCCLCRFLIPGQNLFVHILCPFDFKIVATLAKDSLCTSWKLIWMELYFNYEWNAIIVTMPTFLVMFNKLSVCVCMYVCIYGILRSILAKFRQIIILQYKVCYWLNLGPVYFSKHAPTFHLIPNKF